MESVDGSITSALLTGLTPNVDYEANITASTCAGTSEPTAFSFRIQGAGIRDVCSRFCSIMYSNAVPPAPLLSANGYECNGEYNSFTVSWSVIFIDSQQHNNSPSLPDPPCSPSPSI